jgi:adhesin/invasin
MSVPEPIEVTHAQPAIFTKDGTGKGQGHIYRVTAAGEQLLACPEAPARAGDTLVIYAAGLGLVAPMVEAGAAVPASPLSNTINAVTVTIGAKEARVVFAGLVPGFTGLYQVNAILPEGVAPCDEAPVVLAVAGQASPPVSIAVR